MVRPTDLVVNLRDVELDDKYHVGEHVAKLGALAASFPVTAGFVLTTRPYFAFLEANNLETKIKHLLGAANFDRPESIIQISTHIRNLISKSPMPDNIFNEILNHYEKLKSLKVSVSTTIVTGDIHQHTFDRPHKTFEATGEAAFLDAVRSSWASIFTPDLITHRYNKGINHLKTGLASLVMKSSDAELSGKIFTLDPHHNDKSKLVVQVKNSHSEYVVDRTKLSIEKRLKPVLDHVHVFVSDGKIVDDAIGAHEIIALAKMGSDIEKFLYFPHVLDWQRSGGLYSVNNISNVNLYVKN